MLFSRKPKTQAVPEDNISDPGVDTSFFTNGSRHSKKELPPWLNHFNAKDLKNLFKSSLAAWIMTTFIFVNSTLDVLGQAAFFGCIVLFIVPPSGIVLLHILAGLSIVLGLALGWAWGVITMKAALASRPQADLNAQLLRLQQSIPQNTTNVGQASGQTTYTQIAIFDGFMLDTRVTLTYFFMMGLFVYLVSRLRLAAPKLILISIIAPVVADVYLTIAPLIPTFEGTVPRLLIIPVGVAIGLGTACNLLIFPQSTSRIVLDGIQDILAPMPGFVKALNWQMTNIGTRYDVRRLRRFNADIVASYKSVDASIKFLPMDFSYGKWNSDDIISLQEPLRQVLIAFSELVQLAISQEEVKIKGGSLKDITEALYDEKDPGKYPVAYYHIARSSDFRAQTMHPDSKEMSRKTLKALSASSAPLLQTWYQFFDATNEALAVPARQASGITLEKHQQTLDTLRDAQDVFDLAAGQVIFGTHSHLFDATGKIISPDGPSGPPLLLGLMLGLLYQERMTNLSKAAIKFLETIVQIEKTRHKSRLWFPKGIRRIFSWSLSKEDRQTVSPKIMDRNDSVASTSSHERTKRGPLQRSKHSPELQDNTTASARLENMRKPPGRRRSNLSLVLLAILNWLTNDEGLFALRNLVLTIVLAVPAVIPASAGFYYREKGLWALIVAQMSLVPYASDFVSGIIVRMFGAIAGGVFGLLCWYIGAGSGSGNPYGLSAVMAVVIVVTMWWRLFAPPEQMPAGIMFTSTLYMVVAYSWIDSHIPSYGNPGVGYSIFWRRMLLVTIGFAASTLITFFPRPPSGNRHFRHVLSEQVSSVRDRYALFASIWRYPPTDLIEITEKEAIASEELLSSIVDPIKLTKFEFSTSNIDTKTLELACRLCSNLNIQITQLLLYTARLPLPRRERFMRATGASNERLIADLMAVLTLVQQSLESGSPLPAVMPTPLLARAMLFDGRRQQIANEDTNLRNQLAGEEGRQWVSALLAFVCLLGAVDDLVFVLKRVLGEASGVDLAAFDSEV